MRSVTQPFAVDIVVLYLPQRVVTVCLVGPLKGYVHQSVARYKRVCKSSHTAYTLVKHTVHQRDPSYDHAPVWRLRDDRMCDGVIQPVETYYSLLISCYSFFEAFSRSIQKLFCR
jgi:hypothetical protein